MLVFYQGGSEGLSSIEAVGRVGALANRWCILVWFDGSEFECYRGGRRGCI